MAIAFRNESHQIATGANFSVSEPSGTTTNDVLVYLFEIDHGVTVTPPSGWTTIFSGASVSSAFDYTLAYQVRGGSAANLTWGFTGSHYYEVYVLAFSGCDTVNPIDASAQATSDTGTNFDPPAVTAVSSSAMAIAMGFNWTGSGGGGWTAPGSYTLRSNNATGNDGAMATRLLSSAGTEDPGIFTGAGSNARWAATVTLSPPRGVSLQWVHIP